MVVNVCRQLVLKEQIMNVEVPRDSSMGSYYLPRLKGQRGERDPELELLNAETLWRLLSLQDTWLCTPVRNRLPKQRGAWEKCSPTFPAGPLPSTKWQLAGSSGWCISQGSASWELNLHSYGLNEEWPVLGATEMA